MTINRAGHMCISQLYLPSLIQTSEFHAAMERAYSETKHLRRSGVVGLVLLELDIDDSGKVTRVSTAAPAVFPSARVDVITSNVKSRRIPPASPRATDGRLRRAAAKAVAAATFEPAMRDGVPVPFASYWVGISFAQPDD